ncbi:ABC transporter substrate-binding protein [Phormidium sp. CLA17]|uniref:ABC transporter substrate-binding protein n=1 Tax=Leptolyngbya sp. Cla-17 TaxID=2803751 RepID=UPI001491FEA9|nr:ABC transporter substrate-binding protein [Leptolyngbya sp. Cla-17]MBM0742743.1 ABC transporter substrate-binding protein [Leptolyngbya sp. Cla-17]
MSKKTIKVHAAIQSSIAIALVSVASGILAACSPNPSKDGAITQGNSNPNAKLKSVAVTVGDLSNPFFVLMGRGAETEAKKIGGAETQVTVVSSGYDLNQQFNQIENFVAAKTDIIILNAADSKGIEPAVEKAKQSGSVVIAVDTAAGGGVDATITSNNVQAGQLSCQFIADRLKGKGNIVIVNGPPVISVIERVQGCEQVLAKYPGIKILSKDQNAEGSRDGGLRVMTDLLTSFPQLNAVFAINDPSAVGAELAARQAKRSEFFIVGVDRAPEATQAIADPSSLVVATAAQDPLGMTRKAVQVGNDILYGKRPANPNILIPVKLITRENVSQYPGWK